jgi:anionic cell wall polymer biosynthesis LytR-Cps2A-Psr (LCP) family protein
MNYLIVLKDELLERSTFIYLQLNDFKTLLHFSPEFHLEGLTLGEFYQTGGRTSVEDFFEKDLDLAVDGYVELSLTEWQKVIHDEFAQGLLIEAEEGPIQLAGAELQQYIRYQVDDTNGFSVFQRQQKALKSFFKNFERKRDLFKLLAILKKYPTLVDTTIPFSQMARLFRRYFQTRQLPSKKYALPLADTFRVVDRPNEKKVIVIDFTKNRNTIHQIASGNMG